ncbi:MAG TPA: STAS domain-containing protein [Gemmatimonadaceae bacterium]|jgi:anti-anti-sigma factor|nr:STAS domain-containing protein [Gemmatimonadaceae bacterium]
MVAATDNLGSVLLAPPRLIADTRAEFRIEALAHLERLGADAEALIIDMRQTLDLDASGLGVLVLVQKRAKERGLSTRLRQAPERVRNLLKLTMLDFLFELTD